MEVFEQIYKKYSKRLSVASQTCTLMEDHLLPMIQVQDRANGEIVMQVFNFVDQMGGLDQLNSEGKSK